MTLAPASEIDGPFGDVGAIQEDLRVINAVFMEATSQVRHAKVRVFVVLINNTLMMICRVRNPPGGRGLG